MPWLEVTTVKLREELVGLAAAEGANKALLAQRFGVSRKTLYKWMRRRTGAGNETGWAADVSRRPHVSPARISAQIEEAVLSVRREHPAWGPRTILQVLRNQECWREAALPAASTVCAILRRHDAIRTEESLKRRAFTRFEREAPNEMWQMDFKGGFTTRGGTCHPLTVVDDHSRFAVGVKALADEKAQTTREAMTHIFRQYGLPDILLLDNGSCWGRVDGFYSVFTRWLLRVGVGVSYARPYHPQTKGKNERFNRTLKVEAIAGREFRGLEQCQRAFDDFRHVYNTLRPHQALQMAVPASRYTLSSRHYPEQLPPIQYFASDRVLRVQASGVVRVDKQRYQLGRAFAGELVALRPTTIDGVWNAYYCRQKIAVIDQRDQTCRII